MFMFDIKGKQGSISSVLRGWELPIVNPEIKSQMWIISVLMYKKGLT